MKGTQDIPFPGGANLPGMTAAFEGISRITWKGKGGQDGMEYTEWKRELRRKIQERMDYGKDYTDEEVEDTIDEVILAEEKMTLCPVVLRRRLKKELFDSLRRLDILQIFVEDKTVTEIMINGKDHIFVERAGRLQELDIGFESEEKLTDVIQQIVAGCNRVVNEASPIVDARLAGGSRVNIVMKPVALNGPIVTIRRFPDKPITMEYLLRNNAISSQAAQFLEKLVKAKYNIFVSGGTGSGKTTFLNVLSRYILPEERVITIEDSAELQLQDLPNLVSLETRNGNVEGCREITIRELIRTSLRMRPEGIRIKKGKLKRNKKRFSIPYTLRKHFFCNLIALFSAELLKIIQ